jgi:hypothetical protein
MDVKALKWNLGKNLKLKLERGVGFEMVADAITRNAFQVAKVKSKNHPGKSASLCDSKGKYGSCRSKKTKNPFIYSPFLR